MPFDEVLLFTNVFKDFAIKVAQEYLEDDKKPKDRTLLTVDNIFLLLDMYLNATFIQFHQECYQQTQGPAMGSPATVIVANLIIKDVKHVLSTF